MKLKEINEYSISLKIITGTVTNSRHGQVSNSFTRWNQDENILISIQTQVFSFRLQEFSDITFNLHSSMQIT
jgi:hypothetical protein